jgi:hypothetical protein
LQHGSISRFQPLLTRWDPVYKTLETPSH